MSTPVILVLRRRARLSARRLEGRPREKIVPDAILRDGHAQQAARDLLRMRPVSCYDRFHGIAALVILTAVTSSATSAAEEDFYSGKQLRLILSTGPGGVYDVFG